MVNESKYRFANLGIRFCGGFIDSILLFFLQFFLYELFAEGGFFPYWMDESGWSLFGGLGNPALDGIWYVITYTYLIGFLASSWQATPGMRVFKIKIINQRNGGKISLLTSILRSLYQSVSFIVLLLGYITILFNEKRQGWHDKWAKTYIIYE